MGSLRRFFSKYLTSPDSPASVGQWAELFGQSRPKIAALVGQHVSGTHYIMHKLHGHRNIMGLQEKALEQDLKEYFATGDLPITSLDANQLLPYKQSLQDIRWVLMNKPAIRFVIYHEIFHANELMLIHSFRNPINLYKSWLKGWHKYGQRHFNTAPDINKVNAWFDAELRITLSEFAHFYIPERDQVVNLECLAARPNPTLQHIFKSMDLPHIQDKDLSKLEECPLCGRKLEHKLSKIAGREELVLYCSHDQHTFTGPGGFNYIRSVDPKNFSKWVTEPDSDSLKKRFANIVGPELMDFFEQEAYLETDGVEHFQKLFGRLLEKYRHGPTL